MLDNIMRGLLFSCATRPEDARMPKPNVSLPIACSLGGEQSWLAGWQEGLGWRAGLAGWAGHRDWR